MRSSFRVRFRNSRAAGRPPGAKSWVARGWVMTRGRGDKGKRGQGDSNLLLLSPCPLFPLSPCPGLSDSGQFLQHPPVLQPVLLRVQQRRRRVAVLVEVLGEAALAPRE